MLYMIFRRIRTWFDTSNYEHCIRSVLHILDCIVPYILLQCNVLQDVS